MAEKRPLVWYDDSQINEELRVGDTLPGSGGGSGDVVGPASATDNALARYDGATGKLIQNSVVIVTDTGNVSGVGTLESTVTFTGYAWNLTNEEATGGGNGLFLCAGEVLGDIAFKICDADATFDLLEIEADQGYIVHGATYAATLASNGAVWGYDNQRTGDAANINTQNGEYLHGGVLYNSPFAFASPVAQLTVDFDTGIDSTSALYELKFWGVVGSADDIEIWLQTSSDGGVSYDDVTQNYEHTLIGKDANGTVIANDSTGETHIVLCDNVGNGTGESASGTVRIWFPASAAEETLIEGQTISINSLDEPELDNIGGMRDASAIVNALRILPSSGTISGFFSLTRIKTS